VRILSAWPLGSTLPTETYAATVNLVGAANNEGIACFEGIDNISRLHGVYIHLYGKKYTRAGRKMGHVTILSDNYEDILKKIEMVKRDIKVVAKMG
jgi:5-(carboxyamino)imidazole ribonucleotide synthase